MTMATIFQRDDQTLILRTERADINNLRNLEEFREIGTVVMYDADIDRVNEYFYYLHMMLRKYSEEMSPDLKKFVIEKTGDMIKYSCSGTEWSLFKKGAQIV